MQWINSCSRESNQNLWYWSLQALDLLLRDVSYQPAIHSPLLLDRAMAPTSNHTRRNRGHEGSLQKSQRGCGPCVSIGISNVWFICKLSAILQTSFEVDLVNLRFLPVHQLPLGKGTAKTSVSHNSLEQPWKFCGHWAHRSHYCGLFQIHYLAQFL